VIFVQRTTVVTFVPLKAGIVALLGGRARAYVCATCPKYTTLPNFEVESPASRKRSPHPALRIVFRMSQAPVCALCCGVVSKHTRSGSTHRHTE
jgi:hypothetical protein